MNPNPAPRRRLLAAGLTALAVTAPAQAATAADDPAGGNQLVARHNATGAQADAKSYTNGSAQVASAHGRFVVFSTEAALVRHDRNGLDDVYLRDTVARTTTLVSVTRQGRHADGSSFEPTISDSGRWVAFTTTATNLFRDRNGEVLDVAVKDMRTGRIRLVSRTTGGRQLDRNSFFPVLAGGGRQVAFQTFGAFRPTDQDRREDVYVHELRTSATRQVSLDRHGEDLPGHYVVGDISDDGRYVTWGDDNSAWVRDRAERQTVRFWHEPNDPALPYPGGTVGRPVISGNGRFVAFSTMNPYVVPGDRGHVVDIFRLDLQTGRFRKATTALDGAPADNDSFIPSLSRSGRYVGFSSFASNLTESDLAGSDVFVHDMRTGRTRLASVGPDGTVGNSDSGRTAVAINADGHTLVYESYADNLVRRDTNNLADVFRWHW